MNEDQVDSLQRFKQIFDLEQQIWEIHLENKKCLQKYVFTNWLYNSENYVTSLKHQYLMKKSRNKSFKNK